MKTRATILPIVFLLLSIGLSFGPERLANVCYFGLWVLCVGLSIAWFHLSVKLSDEDPDTIKQALKFKPAHPRAYDFLMFINGITLLIVVSAGKYVLAIVFLIATLIFMGLKAGIVEAKEKFGKKGDN